MLIVRENTQCLYVKQERWVVEGEAAIAERVITRVMLPPALPIRLFNKRVCAKPAQPTASP